MSVYTLSIDRYETTHLLDQVIHDMKGILDAIAEGDSGMDQLFSADLSTNGAAAL